MPYKGDKGDKNAARPPEGSLVETRCLIKGPKSAIVPFAEPRSGPKSRTGPGAVVSVSRVFRIPMHMNVFTYPYISRINIWICYNHTYHCIIVNYTQTHFLTKDNNRSWLIKKNIIHQTDIELLTTKNSMFFKTIYKQIFLRTKKLLQGVGLMLS